MRKNEYGSLEEFISEYSGGRDPANGKWYGLEFMFHNCYYRLDNFTGKYELLKIIFENGDRYPGASRYEELCTFSTIDELLNSKVIENTEFKKVIMDDDTVILGKD